MTRQVWVHDKIIPATMMGYAVIGETMQIIGDIDTSVRVQCASISEDKRVGEVEWMCV